MVPIIRQRADGDCGVAALAMFAAIAYEDVYAVMTRIDRRGGKSSLNNADIVKAAKLLGIRLEPTRVFDPEIDDGVLRVRWQGRRGQKNPGGHFVALKYGLIFCPTDAAAFEWRDYLARYEGRACTLLRGVA